MKPSVLPALLCAALLSGCGTAVDSASERGPSVDRALLFDFPSDEDEAVTIASKIRAQAELVGGRCEEAAVALYNAANQHKSDNDLTEIALANADPMEVDVSDPAWTEATSESYGKMLDAVSAAKDACPPK